MSDDPTTSVPATPAPAPVAAPAAAPAAAGPTWSATASTPPVEPMQPVVSAAKPRKESSGRWLNVLLGIAIAFAIGGVAFAAGRTTAPAAAANGRGAFNGNFGANGPTGSFRPGGSFTPGANGGFFGGRGAGGLAISGTVQSVDGDKLTITTDNGQTITITTGATTTYHTQADASASDVTNGTKVSVKLDLVGRTTNQGNGGNGNANPSDGTTGASGTASDVTIVP